MTELSVIAFPGAPNLPVFAAMEKGFFKEAGLRIRFETTPSSVYQFKAFGTGAFDIAFTAFDNVVAYDEGQGAAELPGRPDFRAVMGCTKIELGFVVAPEVKAVGDLRGRSVALDAVGTGFAFVLYEMLSRSGLQPGEYEVVPVGATPERWQSVKAGQHAGTITIEPFTSIANANGFPTLLTSGDFFPSYQGGVIAVRRDWADANAEALGDFLRVYRRGLGWVLDPANREEATTLLSRRMPEIQPKALATVMKSLLSPETGLTPDGSILPEGARAVLDLRSKYGLGKRALEDVGRYLDLRWQESADA